MIACLSEGESLQRRISADSDEAGQAFRQEVGH
jgi:hypothetical protein